MTSTDNLQLPLRTRARARARFAATLLCFVLTPAFAFADDISDLGITVRAQVQVGQRPAVVVEPRAAFRQISITLTPDGGGRPTTVKGGATAAGERRALEWNQSVGTQKWALAGTVAWADGNQGQFELTFDTTVFPKIASSIGKQDVDLANRTLRVRLNQPAEKADIVVTGDDGQVMHQGSQDLNGAEAGSQLELTWDQQPGVAVLKIDLKLWSTFGFWIGLEITPFEVEIPHEDVEFATGDAAVRPGEAGKLQHTLELLKEKLARYGGLVKLELYVAGYTDTVGSKGSNQELSERRARSIGGWFKSHGLGLPIFYQGFGEDALAVPTPDETDRAANRRALYVLSASPPSTQASVPRSNWRRL